MKTTILLLLLCWPFHRARTRHPLPSPPPRPAPARPAGHYEITPHPDDGYWVEYIWRGGSRGKWYRFDEPMPEPVVGFYDYPFSKYRWEWDGITKDDRTWNVEDRPGRQQTKPAARELVPDHIPFMPGSRENL